MVDRDSKLESAPSTETIERSPSSLDAQESPDADLGIENKAAGVLDSVDGGQEEGTEAMGHVSESVQEGVGENRRNTGGRFQKFQQQMSEEEAADLKKRLLKTLPPKRKMVQEIRGHIKKEIMNLQRDARAHRRAGNWRQFCESVRRMRELKHILIRLFYATADVVKNVWLKVVHGIV